MHYGKHPHCAEAGRIRKTLQCPCGFDEGAWYALVDHATVYGRDDVRFTFKNGMEIKA